MNGDLLSTLEGPKGCSRPRLIQSPTEGNCMIYYDKGHFCLFSVNGKLLKHVEVEDSIKVKGRRKGKNKNKLSAEQNFCSGPQNPRWRNKLYASDFLAFISFVLLHEEKAFSPMELFCCSTSSGHRGKTSPNNQSVVPALRQSQLIKSSGAVSAQRRGSRCPLEVWGSEALRLCDFFFTHCF